MNRARSPLVALLPVLALACAHAPDAAPAEEHPVAAHPAPAPAPREAIAATPPPKVSKAAERPASAGHPSAASPSPATPAKSAAAARPAAPSAAGKAEAVGAAEYFPLAVGNEWLYVDQSPALPENRRGVVRTVRIVERTADGFYRDNERGTLRVDGNCVRDRDRSLLCQPFTVGASWSSVLSATTIERYEIAAAGETVETPAGKFERCVRVRAHNRVKASIDQVLEITYAPRVGPVLIETFVVVDGRVTPQVKAMLQSYKLNGGI